MDTPEPPQRACRKCGTVYPCTPEHWHRNKTMADGLHTVCRVCRSAYQRGYEARLVEKRSTAYARRLRDQALEAYGGPTPTCACCGEAHRQFLAIDHINGGGSKQRRAVGGNVSRWYRWLRDHHYPPGFRILCHNCNCAIGWFGACPHERERQRTP